MLVHLYTDFVILCVDVFRNCEMSAIAISWMDSAQLLRVKSVTTVHATDTRTLYHVCNINFSYFLSQFRSSFFVEASIPVSYVVWLFCIFQFLVWDFIDLFSFTDHCIIIDIIYIIICLMLYLVFVVFKIICICCN